MRNASLDYFRGVATFNIIFIHTVWWSGEGYVPENLRNFSLLIDVPLFFFLAGLAFSYLNNLNKGVTNLFRLQLRYFIFICLYTILRCLVIKEFSLEQFINWSLHLNYNEPYIFFNVVMGSMWFMKIYLIVSLLGVVMVSHLKNRKLVILAVILLLSNVLLFFTNFHFQNVAISGITISYLIFYLLFFVAGFLLKNAVIGFKHLCLVTLLVTSILVLFCLVTEINIFDIQKYKFPPTLIYLLWSIPGIFIFLFFKNSKEFIFSNFFSAIGKNAIYFYFAQGFSSSLLFYLLPKFDGVSWRLKLIALFLANLLLCYIFYYIIKFLIEGAVIKLNAGYNKAAIMVKRNGDVI